MLQRRVASGDSHSVGCRGPAAWSARAGAGMALPLRTRLSRRVRAVGHRVEGRTAGSRCLVMSRRQAVVAGNSVALLGAKWVDPVARRHWCTTTGAPNGITVHTDTLLDGDVVELGGMAVTSAARTAFDIARHALRLLAVRGWTRWRTPPMQDAGCGGGRRAPPGCSRSKAPAPDPASSRRRGGVATGELEPVGVSRCRISRSTHTDRDLRPRKLSHRPSRYGVGAVAGRCGIRRRLPLDGSGAADARHRPLGRGRRSRFGRSSG